MEGRYRTNQYILEQMFSSSHQHHKRNARTQKSASYQPLLWKTILQFHCTLGITTGGEVLAHNFEVIILHPERWGNVQFLVDTPWSLKPASAEIILPAT